MKLATLRNSRPDGQLVVLSADRARFVSAGRIAPKGFPRTGKFG